MHKFGTADAGQMTLHIHSIVTVHN